MPLNHGVEGWRAAHSLPRRRAVQGERRLRDGAAGAGVVRRARGVLRELPGPGRGGVSEVA